MAGREVARGDCKADLVVQLARGRDVAVLLNVEPQTRLAQRCGATIRIFGAGDNCNPGITGCAGWGRFASGIAIGRYSCERLAALSSLLYRPYGTVDSLSALFCAAVRVAL